ncbi:MAG TPA: serine/threonine-protein kinase [Kofleriaceae bacterium]|nr:serine/threonine-protein kinase [Kofleriaceae bacterium]
MVEDGSAVTLPAGRSVGRYVIIERLGAGGMGVVYAAHDPELDRKVAIKLLREPGDPARQARLQREAQAMARLSDANVIVVHDVGRHDEHLFVAMELIEGETLRQWLERTRPPWREVIAAFVRAGSGLAAAHRAGIVHRDFKPDNVLVGGDGRVAVTDFGLARATPDADEDGQAPAGARPGGTVTQTGARLGTPAYMAPEQYRGDAADARSDQFSFCVALYEALYGERPFGPEPGPGLDSSDAAALAVVTGKLADPPAGTRVPARVRRALHRGLAAAPGDRYPSMPALLAQLGADSRLWWRRVGLAALAALLAAALAAGLVLWLRPGDDRAAAAACRGLDQPLRERWNPARREAVAAAFARSHRPFAATTLATVQQRLDDFAGTWIAARTDACADTRVRGEQSEAILDLRMACLDRGLAGLGALVRELATADDRTVDAAVTMIGALPPPGDCDDAESLAQAVPLPADPATRARVTAAQDRLTEVEVLMFAGKAAEAGRILEQVLAEGRAVGYRPLEAEALVDLGQSRERSGDLKAAEPLYYDAIAAAEEGRADRVRLRAWMQLLWLHQERSQFAEAHRDVRQASALMVRAPANDYLRADLIEFEGLVYWGEQDLGRAAERIEKALAMREALQPHEEQRIANTLINLTGLYVEQGRNQEALTTGQRARGMLERIVGEAHPDVGRLLNNIAAAADNLERHDEALQLFRRSLAIMEGHLGPDHPDLAYPLVNIGELSAPQGHLAEAESSYRRALALWEKSLGPADPMLSHALVGLGAVLDDQRRFAEALPLLRRALALREHAETPPTHLARIRFALARALAGSGGDHAAARRLASDARKAYHAAGQTAEVQEIDAWLAGAQIPVTPGDAR